MRCPACAHQNRDVDRFCIACGARLELTCPQCGVPAPAGARFCGACGGMISVRPEAEQSHAQTNEPAPDGERRQLTVLFCDLVDSTALSARLDPEELRDLVRAYQQICSDVIARYRGHIAQYLGDGILVYFGYPQAHEDDGINAVRSALSIIAGTRSLRLPALPAVDLAVRAGIHTGLVVVGESWRQATDGELEVIVIAGGPGIGKSRLLRVLRERLDDAGDPYAWVELRGAQMHEHSALYPLIDHYQRLLQFAPENTVERRLGKLEATLREYGFPLAEMMPLFAPLLSLPLPDRYSPTALTAERQKQRTLEASLEWLRKEAMRQPVLFVVEDLQWIDPSTVEMVSLLIDQQPETRILALLTCRPEFTTPWSLDDHLHLRTLGRLGRAQVIAVARGIAGEALPLEIEAQIVARTDGVPLFVEELTRTVLESGLVEVRDGHYVLTGALRALAIPETLHDSLMARLDRLATVKEVAQLGAVVGREFSYSLIQAVVRTDEAALQRALSRLVDAGLLSQRGQHPSARYRFRHSLIQEAAYESLLRSRRQQLHLQVAHVLEERFPDVVETQPELLAHHFATAGDREHAVNYLIKAGRRAAERYAIQEALSFFERALELRPMSAARDEILQERGKLLLGLFRGAEAVRDFEQLLTNARESGDRQREVESLLGLGAAHYILSLDEPGGAARFREVYERAFALASEIGDRAAMARALIPTQHFTDYWPEYRPQAITNVERALALSRELVDDELVIEATMARLRYLNYLEAEQPGEELLRLLESRRDLLRLNQHTFRLMWVHQQAGNFEQSIECCDAGIRLAAEIGALPVQYATIKALSLLGLGRYGEAWEALQQEVTDDAHPFGRAMQELGVGAYLVALMDYDGATVVFRDVIEQAHKLNRAWMRRAVAPQLAMALLRRGLLDDAALTQVRGDLKEIGLSLLPDAEAEILLGRGDAGQALPRAEAAIAEAVELGHRPNQLAALELKLRILLSMQRAAEAVALACEALELGEAMKAQPLLWRIRAARARAHRILGDVERAMEGERAAGMLLRKLAATIPNPRLKHGFLSDPEVASLVAASEQVAAPPQE